MSTYMLLYCIVALAVLRAHATQVSFKGREYFSYSLKKTPITSDKNVFSLRFKTIHPSGLLFYCRGIYDYIKLELHNGVLKYTLFLGGNEKTVIQAGTSLFDGKWHLVKIQRRGRMTSLKLDNQSPTAKILPGLLDLLYLNNYVFVGGMMDMLKTRHGITTPNYKGCLGDLLIDDIDILQGAHKATSHQHATLYNIYGNIPFQCHVQNYEPVTFMTPHSFVKVSLPKLPQDNGSFVVSFQFRTFFPNGLLLSRNAVNVKMSIGLKAGALIYDVTVRNGSKHRIAVGGLLDNGEWHDVTASISTSKLSLTLDGYLRTVRINMTSSLHGFLNQSWTKVFVGARAGKFPGFVGCMLNLKVDSQKVVLRLIGKKRFSFDVDVSKCFITDRCSPNPCRNRGVCTQDWRQFHCDCSKTYFEGKTCQTPLLKPTCDDYRRAGLGKDAHCLLHTGSEMSRDRFTALCNVTDPSKSYTVIEHSLQMESMIRVRDLDLVGDLYRASKVNYYNIENSQIKALMKQSQHCRQYVRFDCIRHNTISTSNTNHVIWKHLDAYTKYNTLNTMNLTIKCACSKSNSQCANPLTKLCKCNRGSRWMSMEGYLTSKERLPVKELVFNKTVALQSTFKLGPLECWGKSDQRTVDTNTRNIIDMACYYVESPTVAKATAIPTVKQCREKERCFDKRLPTDMLGPIEWTNPPNLETASTQENSHFNVQSRETSFTGMLNASRFVTFVSITVIWMLA